MSRQALVCIAGKNRIAVHGLMTAIALLGRDSVVACPNATDDGRSGWQPSLRHYASELGIRIVTLEECYELKDVVFVSLEFDRLVDPSRFRSTKLFNIHFSLLPAYKGVYTSAWPILNGEQASGVSLHCIDHGIDTGNVIDQVDFPLEIDETARSLYFKYLDHASELIDTWIEDLISKDIKGVAQPIKGSSYYGKNSIRYSDLSLQLRQVADSIERQIRAFSFREFQTPRTGEFPIGACEFTNDRSVQRPGALRPKNADSMVLATIDYDLLLHKSHYEDLFSAVSRGDIGAVEALIQKGVVVDQTNDRGWSPLMMACYSGDLDLSRLLVDQGANVNQANSNGTTCLMYAKEACERTGDFDLCALLIAAGADPHKSDAFSRSVLDYARRAKQSKAVAFFEGLG